MSLEGTIDHQARNRGHQGMRALGEVLAFHAGSALLVGGLAWVATYVVEILIGVLLGEAIYASPEVSSSWLVWLWPATFMFAILCLATGLLGVAVQVRHRGRPLAVLGGLLAMVALAASSVNLVRLTGVAGAPSASDGLGFLGVVGVLGGSVLIGAAAIRGKVLAVDVPSTANHRNNRRQKEQRQRDKTEPPRAHRRQRLSGGRPFLHTFSSRHEYRRGPDENRR